jgi:hypothetical protein
MPTIAHQPVSAITALQSAVGFLKTVDRIDTELDEIRIGDSTLAELIDASSYFQEEYVDKLEELRDLVGACIAQACSEANIPGIRHWTDNHPDPLATHYQQFQRQYYNFLTGLRRATEELTALAGEDLTEEDLTALYGLTAPLASPMMLTKTFLEMRF